MIGATSFWSAPGVDAGAGMKIAILDDGLDQSHPFFSPAAFAMPAGFPKGQAAYTTGKVIVARAFPPRGLTWKNRNLPFDPEHSSHATHVSGIAAGNAGTLAGNVRVSGVAPRAYLGNYKVLTVPTEGFGLNGNAPEIAAGVEAAVADGMDVINLSLGEPEIEPTRDLVALAIEGAAARGRADRRGGGQRVRSLPARFGRLPRERGLGDQRRLRLQRPRRSCRIDLVVLVGGADAVLAPAQARRRRTRLVDPLVDSRGRLVVAQRDEHGRAARHGCGCAAPQATSGVDARAAQVGTRHDRLDPSERAVADRRRVDRRRSRGRAAALRRAELGLVRARARPARTPRSSSGSRTPAAAQARGR